MTGPHGNSNIDTVGTFQIQIGEGDFSKPQVPSTPAEIWGILHPAEHHQCARARPRCPRPSTRRSMGRGAIPSGAYFRSQGARKNSGPSLQGLRAEDAIQSQATAPNHGHPRFWHRGAWGSRIAPSPSPSTLSSVLITACIGIGRLNGERPAHASESRQHCPRGSGTYSLQHSLSGRTPIPVFRRCMLLSAFREHRLTHQQLSM